ncbi:MAG: hypothetical protein M3R70_01115, partial [Actinomycetota bacterium]|nr:hypothetical protein [Actinomycetota bacterium]
RLPEAEKYLKYRVRLMVERSPDRQDAFALVRDFLRGFEESPDRHDALQFAADRLALTPEMQSSVSASAATITASLSPKLLEAGERLERDALAGCATCPAAMPLLAELSPEHFDLELHRRAQDHLVHGTEPDRELTPLVAELNARAEAEGIDEETTKELLLRLRERQLRRQLARAEGEQLGELQEALKRVRTAADELAWADAAET